MNNKTKTYIAAGLGILVGLLSFVSGSSVLLGIKLPDYTVIEWLVTYNVIMGAISIAVGLSIYLKSRWALRSAVLIAAAHLVVLIALLSLWFFSDNTVAVQSLGAMTFRSIVWVGITIVVWKNGNSHGK